MKKIFAMMFASLFVLSACGGGASQSGTTTTTSTAGSASKNADLVGYMVDNSCAIAKSNGDLSTEEDAAIANKHGFNDASEVDAAITAALPDRASIVDQAVPQIVAKCNDDFVKAGQDPKNLLNGVFDEFNK